MKQRTKIIAGAAVLAFLPFAAGNLQAQVTNAYTITATALVQGGTNDNGTVTTIAAPTKLTIDTAFILPLLAKAENEEGNYNSTTFPTGAELVAVGGSGGNPDFQVVEKDGAFLVDVSDILSLTDSGTYGSHIISGKENDTTGLVDPTETKAKIATLAYDDTGAGGSLQFVLTGLSTGTKTDTTPNKAGVYKETRSGALTDGAGDGNYQGNPLVITGSLKVAGKATLTLGD